MVPRPTITIRRADKPRWLPFCSGEIDLDDRRVALLIGEKPRTVVVRPGERAIGVRLTDRRRPLDVTRTVRVEEGQSYRFRCGVTVQNPAQTYFRVCVMAVALFAACTVGYVAIPLLREPALAWLADLYQETSWIGPRLFPLLDRLVRILTSQPGGTAIAMVAFLLATRQASAALGRRFLHFLEEE
jgi:hypothetical protein